MKKTIKSILNNKLGLDLHKVRDPLPLIYNENMLGLLKKMVVALNNEGLDAVQEKQIKEFCLYVISNKNLTYSQLFQDLAFLFYCGVPGKNGVFVEVGVGNGLDHSNSYMLEKKFSMGGLMIEPDPRQKSSIESNRTGKYLNYAASSSDCLLEFNMALIPELSWTGRIAPSDSLERISTQLVKVKARPLNSILNDTMKSNSEIDFLSIDVEGGEEEVLKGFNLEQWNPKFVCIEHNRCEKNKKFIYSYFSKKYILVLEELSDCDYWFLRKDLVS